MGHYNKIDLSIVGKLLKSMNDLTNEEITAFTKLLRGEQVHYASNKFGFICGYGKIGMDDDCVHHFEYPLPHTIVELITSSLEFNTNKKERITFDGRKISYDEISHQHASNIIWYDRIFKNRENKDAHELIDKKFDGYLLNYAPKTEFKYELNYLKSNGHLKKYSDQSYGIYFHSNLIGFIISDKTIEF